MFELRRGWIVAGFTLSAAVALSQPLPKAAPPVTERPAAPSGPLIPSTPLPAPSNLRPKLEAVAEAKLLMEGMGKPNLDALAKLLKEKPSTAEEWTFARGQSLLIAEMGNLLMLRPPRAKAAEDTWLARSAELRTVASKLASAAGEKDYAATRAALATLANTCNRCHESFRIPTRVVPFE